MSKEAKEETKFESRLDAHIRLLTQTPSKCPRCGGTVLSKDGYVERLLGPFPQYLCKTCGYRFHIWKDGPSQAELKKRKREKEMKFLTRTPEQCPQCGSKRIWKNAHTKGRYVPRLQRYSCRECGLRFSKY